MGQLFDRLRNYVRASVSSHSGPTGSSWSERMLDSDDDELRRIIEELSREGASASDTADTASGSTSPYQREKPPAAIPPDVLRAHTTLNVPVSADATSIKQAYKAAIARWHPDRHVNAPTDQQAIAQRRAREINDAYSTLKKFYSIA